MQHSIFRLHRKYIAPFTQLHGVCSLNANSDLHWMIEVCTATQMQITTFISITYHYWRSPAVLDSSCKTSSELCRQSLDVSDPFIRVPSGASFQTVEVLGC